MSFTGKRFIKKTACAVLLPLVLACSTDEFEGVRPDERLGATLESYEQLLSGAQHGWKAHLYPAGGGGYGFLFRFNDQNRVTMLADISTETGSSAKESSYRLKAALLPSLYFDTYSYIHLLADPDPSVNGGEPGWGRYSDFEFAFVSVSPDTIRLKGNLSGSRLELIRADAGEAAAYAGGNLNTIRQQVADFLQGSRFSYLEDAAGTVFSTALNLDMKTLSLVYDSAGSITTKTVGLAFSGHNELVLSDTLRLGRLLVDRLRINSQSEELEAVWGQQSYPFWQSDRPLFPLIQLWGIQYESIRVPMEVAEQGNGTEFDTRRAAFLQQARAMLAPGTTFPEMRLTVDRSDELLFVNQIIRQGSSNFQANFVFSYTLDDDRFVLRYEGPADGNATLIEGTYVPVLEGFLYGGMRFDYDLQTDNLRAWGESSGLPGFKFVGTLQ